MDQTQQQTTKQWLWPETECNIIIISWWWWKSLNWMWDKIFFIIFVLFILHSRCWCCCCCALVLLCNMYDTIWEETDVCSPQRLRTTEKYTNKRIIGVSEMSLAIQSISEKVKKMSKGRTECIVWNSWHISIFWQMPFGTLNPMNKHQTQSVSGASTQL